MAYFPPSALAVPPKWHVSRQVFRIFGQIKRQIHRQHSISTARHLHFVFFSLLHLDLRLFHPTPVRASPVSVPDTA
eukprot:478076-Rhodomonas_salina.1